MIKRLIDKITIWLMKRYVKLLDVTGKLIVITVDTDDPELLDRISQDLPIPTAATGAIVLMSNIKVSAISDEQLLALGLKRITPMSRKEI